MTTRLPLALLVALALTRAAMAGEASTPPSRKDEPEQVAVPGAIARQAGNRLAPSEILPAPHRKHHRRGDGLLLFVSRGMPMAELRAALDAAAHFPGLTLVLRGIPPGETLATALPAIASLLGRRAPGAPSLVIDPPAFRRHGIDAVPALVEPATGRRFLGAITAQVLEHPRRGAEAKGPERVGPTWPIAEPDLVAALQARAAALDLPGRAQAALQRFWRHVPVLVLPPVSRGTVRRLRPAAVTATDLIDHRGRVLLPARTALNPLETLPLTLRLLVIDAQSPQEIAWARRQQRHDGRTTLVLATNPDRSAGWEGWRALQHALEIPVYLLDRHLAERLGLRATPTRIEAQGQELVLTETALPRQAAP